MGGDDFNGGHKLIGDDCDTDEEIEKYKEVNDAASKHLRLFELVGVLDTFSLDSFPFEFGNLFGVAFTQVASALFCKKFFWLAEIIESLRLFWIFLIVLFLA